MTSSDQRRTTAMTRLVAGELTVAEVAVLLGRSERSIWRLRRRYVELGVDAIVHGNRGRASPRRLAEATRTRILELAATVYDGANDSHLAELLAERDGIVIGRSSLQRLLRSAGRASPRHRRAPRHRSRRDRMPQAGLLVQLDGSRHDWLAERGPRLTLVGGIDDATGIVTGATFRDQEDAAGYLVVLRDTVRRHGVPVAVYRDRHGIFETPERATLTLEEQLADRRTPTQVGRSLAELGIGSIAARSPPGEGSDRAPVGDVPGSTRRRAQAGRGGRSRDGQPGPRPVRRPLQPALCRSSGERRGGLGSAAGTGRARPDLLAPLSPGRRPRRDGPGRGDDPPAGGPGGPPQPGRSAGRAPAPARRTARRVGWRARPPDDPRPGRPGPAPGARRGPGRGRHARPQSRLDRPATAQPPLAAGRGGEQALPAATVRIAEQMS